MSTDVLDDLAALRRRVRGDRHAYAFPLFLFGTLILLAPLCYWAAPQPTDFEFYWDKGPFPQFTSSGMTRFPGLVGWYWVLTIVGGLWLTGWWYRRRARQHGVETDTHVATIAAVAVLLGFLIWQPLFSTVLDELFDFDINYSTLRFTVPILVGGTAVAAVAVVMSTRRTGRARITAVAVAAFFATLAFGALSIYLTRGYAALVIIAATLLVLAWAERSVLLAVVSVVFTGVALLVNLYKVDYIFTRLGWSLSQNIQYSAFQSLLVPGAVLLVGGVAAVLGNRR